MKRAENRTRRIRQSAALALSAAVALSCLMGLSGCRNACQKQASQIVDCIEDYCEGNPDTTRCSEQAIERVADLVRTSALECTDEMAAAIPADNSCDNILVGLGYAAPSTDESESH